MDGDLKNPNENTNLATDVFSSLVKVLHLFYYSWKAQIVTIIEEMFPRTQLPWVLFISMQSVVHAAPCHMLVIFSLCSFLCFSLPEDLFLESIEIREFSGSRYNK